MSTLDAAKINLALVVGPLRADGKHEVATVLQHIDLVDVITLTGGKRLSVSGFAADSIVTEALGTLAAAAGSSRIGPSTSAKRSPSPQDSAAAAPMQLPHFGSRTDLSVPLGSDRLEELAASIGADVPFFLRRGPQLGTGDGSVLAPVELPQDFSVVLVLPKDELKTSTAEVYDAFDARGGAAGFELRRAQLLDAVAAVRFVDDLALLPSNDLASSPLSARLRELGAIRADASGAGPCVYGLFALPRQAEEAARALRSAGHTWVASPR